MRNGNLESIVSYPSLLAVQHCFKNRLCRFRCPSEQYWFVRFENSYHTTFFTLSLLRSIWCVPTYVELKSKFVNCHPREVRNRVRNFMACYWLGFRFQFSKVGLLLFPIGLPCGNVGWFIDYALVCIHPIRNDQIFQFTKLGLQLTEAYISFIALCFLFHLSFP